jgi:archaellum component FlaC
MHGVVGYVDEEMKETRLQGLKDQLAGADEDTAELQAEIEELEQRINELTSFAREHLIIPVQLVSSQHPRR